MRVRVPVAVRNRLLRVEARRPVNLPIGGWPSLMDLDKWEALASGMQDELAASAYEEIRPMVEEQPPVPVPPTVRKAEDGLGQRSAIEEFLEAQRRARERAMALKLKAPFAPKDP